LDIEDGLLMQAKAFAAKAHTSLTYLIEESLSLRLRAGHAGTNSQRRASLPVYAGRGGLRPTVRNSVSHRALLDAADEADLAR
jgi:hypothetical protein